ncbi:ankyrin repeat domain-containing protein [Candidatus Dependentiae bacterium]|nr:ankyrin repeat domain-containing protein [Candidatus Dependentiae bacterium]
MKKILLLTLALLFSKAIFTMKRPSDYDGPLVTDFNNLSLVSSFNNLSFKIKKNIIDCLIATLPNSQTLVRQLRHPYSKATYKQKVQDSILPSLRSWLSLDKEISSLLLNQEYIGQLICSLACKYTLSNYEIAEMIGTRTAAEWCIAHPELLEASTVSSGHDSKVARVLFPALPTTRQLLFSLCSLKLIKDAEKEEALRQYAHEGNGTAVQALIQSGCNVNAVNDMDKLTALHRAVKSNHPEIVQLLIDAQAVIETQDYQGDTPLKSAVLTNNRELVHLLLVQNPKPNVDVPDKDGKTPLMHAIACDYTKVATRLILANADCYAQDMFGNTPSSIAFEKGNSKIMRFLDILKNLNNVAR